MNSQPLSSATEYPTQPAANADKTFTAIVSAPVRRFPGYGLLSLRLPAGHQPQELVAGRFFMVRCGAQSEFERLHNWHFYTRKALYAAAVRKIPAAPLPDNRGHTAADHAYEAAQLEEWQLLIPHPSFTEASADPSLQWLHQLQPGASLNLLGLFGQGFTLAPNSRRLLLTANAQQVAILFSLIEPMLDRGGHVTLIVDAAQAYPQTAPLDAVSVVDTLIPQLPIAVEAHVAATPQEYEQQLGATIPWTDQICAAIQPSQHQPLADQIRNHRFRLDSGFAQVLVQADLLCGIGACLACVVSLPSGALTRGCVRGPVMDLTRLVHNSRA